MITISSFIAGSYYCMVLLFEKAFACFITIVLHNMNLLNQYFYVFVDYFEYNILNDIPCVRLQKSYRCS